MSGLHRTNHRIAGLTPRTHITAMCGAKGAKRIIFRTHLEIFGVRPRPSPQPSPNGRGRRQSFGWRHSGKSRIAIPTVATKAPAKIKTASFIANSSGDHQGESGGVGETPLTGAQPSRLMFASGTLALQS